MSDNRSKTILDWLGFQSGEKMMTHRWFGRTLGWALSAIFLFVLFSALALLAISFTKLFTSMPDDSNDAVRNFGLILAAVFTAGFAAWRGVILTRQADTAEQGHITDRYIKAVEQLGAEKVQKIEGKETTVPNIEVRVGALYTLERIAADSLRDHIPIMETICAYVRNNSPAKSLEPTKPPFTFGHPKADIQTAIDIIGRRNQAQKSLEQEKRFRLDLSKTDLSFVDFRGGDFSAARFVRCRIEAASFRSCPMHGTILVGSLVNYSDFNKAQLIGARLDHCVINLPTITPGTMSESINFANLFGVCLAGAELSAINYLGEVEDVRKTFGSKDTILHHEIEFKADYVRELNQELRIAKRKNDSVKLEALSVNANKESYLNWLPHPKTDTTFGWSHHEFLKKLNLNKWPYTD